MKSILGMMPVTLLRWRVGYVDHRGIMGQPGLQVKGYSNCGRIQGFRKALCSLMGQVSSIRTSLFTFNFGTSRITEVASWTPKDPLKEEWTFVVSLCEPPLVFLISLRILVASVIQESSSSQVEMMVFSGFLE